MDEMVGTASGYLDMRTGQGAPVGKRKAASG